MRNDDRYYHTRYSRIPFNDWPIDEYKNTTLQKKGDPTEQAKLNENIKTL